MTVIRIRYQSTNCYFIDTGRGLLAFDAGWPNTYREYKDCLKEQGYLVKNIKWLIVSHFHIDHAGLAGILSEHGVTFVVFRNQVDAIQEMESLIERKKMTYHKLDLSQVHIMEIGDSRKWLESIGIRGEVLHTNGHGEQSISLILDDGDAFIGDLAPENMIGDDDWKSKNSWDLLKSKGARQIRPAHANEYSMSD
jgi:glyoxylase-like metal-dependent hydrolase (beta-lactamase superfamily II)